MSVIAWAAWTLPATGAGRGHCDPRGTRLGDAMAALTEWAIRRTTNVSDWYPVRV